MPYGGDVAICLRRLDEDPDLDAGTVALRILSSEAAQLLYRLMSDGELILLPPVIAASAEVAQTVKAPGQNVRVVRSASELRDILARGPYEWWSAGRVEDASLDSPRFVSF